MSDLFVSLMAIGQAGDTGDKPVPGTSPSVKKTFSAGRRLRTANFVSPLLVDLAAFYKLDGNAQDSLGVHHGTGYGAWGAASPPGYYVTGKDGQGFSMTPGEALQTPFDGWHQTRIDISPPIVLSVGTPWAINVWVKFGGTPPGVPPDQIINSSSTGLGLRANFGSRISPDGSGLSNTNITAGWHMLTQSFSLADGITVKFYYDGVADGGYAWPFTGPPTMSIDRMLMSGFSRVGASLVIDDVGVWHRGLTPSDVTTLFNGGSGKSYPF